jgi:pimeloyl-ACP methyl ester carboxylesterase
MFARAYQDMVDRWPEGVTTQDVPTGYGSTHVLMCGPGTAPAVLLLPGGGATATAWFAVAAGLCRSHRVIAVDPIGQPGLSRQSDRPVKTAGDLTGWLDEVLAALAVERVVLAGHSYGAWIALRYALHAPGRVERLILLDPTVCFAPMSLRYRLHAIPLLVRPGSARMSRFLAWETRGRPLDPGWLVVVTAGHALGRARIVMPRLPRPNELARLGAPTLVVTAARSRAHDPGEIARRARDRLPDVATATLAGASHHSIPTEDAGEIVGCVEGFLARR